MHQISDVISIFDHCFWEEFNTRLLSGGCEPVYLPANSEVDYHRIVFTEDYFSSALHEVAHWCIAGLERRAKVDYGYWYAPDGRTELQQSAFEVVEVAPQAIEWIFSTAASRPFRVSADNLEQGLGASDDFKGKIAAHAQRLCMLGLPYRARKFAQALASRYCGEDYLCERYYSSDLL